MEFVVEKKLLDSALKQLLFGRGIESEEPVDLATSGATLTLTALGTSAEVPVNCDKNGRVSIAVRDLVSLKKISRSYKPGPVRIRIGDGRIHFQKTSLSYRHSTALARCAEEASDKRRAIDIPNDASILDLVSLPEIFTQDEIEACGLHTRVANARESITRMMGSAIASMCELGFIRSEVSAMVDSRLKSHAATMRRVLFPEEHPSEFANSQHPELNNNVFEKQELGEKQMNEAEMKAELERLREENTQLKTKEKGVISLKVSDKGAVSLYGMGRFPVTLYKEQWLRILASAPQIEAFIRENDAKLKTKE